MPNEQGRAPRHAVVTGASSGIGRAIAESLLAEGWRVSGLDVAQPAIVRGGFAHWPVNLADGGDIARVAAALPAVDALVHAAGVLRVGPLGQLDHAGGELMWRLHVDAATHQPETRCARARCHRCSSGVHRMHRTRTDLLRRHARAGISQRVLQRAVDEVMHQPRITKAHLVLGRVHVDINAGRVELKEQHIGRLATVVQHVAVSHLHRMGDTAVAHRTAVDVQVLLVGAGP